MRREINEAEVVGLILEGESPGLNVLRKHLQEAAFHNRSYTGIGFTTEIVVPPGAVRLKGEPNFKFGDVDMNSSALQYGVGFILYAENGLPH